ncbi:hypothetical protein OAX78_01360 [Planctomycetota bacterium]|nr:hypothetical protein [Planctomycetota bacterium]
MIEVNLLPPEYRPREKTPLPLFVTVVLGITLVGAIFIYEINLNSKLAQLTDREAQLVSDTAEVQVQVDKVKELDAEIKTLEVRQKSIISISQSKIMWSLKLVQLSRIMNEFQSFWIQNLSLTKARGGGQLQMQVNATGNDMREVARFRDALQQDPNFFYHFQRLVSDRITFREVPRAIPPIMMAFRISLPLKTAPNAGTRRRR